MFACKSPYILIFFPKYIPFISFVAGDAETSPNQNWWGKLQTLYKDYRAPE